MRNERLDQQLMTCIDSNIFEDLDILMTDLETNEAKINVAIEKLLTTGPKTNFFDWNFSTMNLQPDGELKHLVRLVQSMDSRVLKNKSRIWRNDTIIPIIGIVLASFYIVVQFGAV